MQCADRICAMKQRNSRRRRKTAYRVDIGSENDTERRRLPDFIVVGPPRTGTTWLDRVLRGHVELPADVKETQFFAWNFGLGIDWYGAFFRNCDPLSLAGEIAPTYFDKPIVRHRIVRLLPHCKIICSLRDPVARVYSQYKTWHRSGLVRAPFDYDLLKRKLGANGSYAFNVRAWQKAYGTANVVVQLYEDLKRNDQSYIDGLCSFIGIPRIALAKTKFGRHEINPSEESPRSLALARFGGRLRTWATRHP
jgi:sulfotransferase family protein